MDKFNRRQFLKYSALTMAASSLFVKPFSLLADTKGKTFTDYKALVCIFMEGGVDGFNLLLPADGTYYDEYKATRQGMALEKKDILSIQPSVLTNFTPGVHSKLPGFKTFFENKKLSFIANVGNLTKPTTRTEYKSGIATVPDQLFSHSSQQKQWQVLNTDSTTAGWAGRLADLIQESNATIIPPNINFSDFNYWQAGNKSKPYKMNPNGLIELYGMTDINNKGDMKRKEIFEKILNTTGAHEFEKAYIDIQKQSALISSTLSTKLDLLPVITTSFPKDSNLGKQLLSAAKMIAIQKDLNMPRLIFFVKSSGYDTHDKQISSMNDNFTDLNDSLIAFQNSLVELGVDKQVVTFSASEFGRTLTSNGDGTDHGWGNHAFLMGTPVDGGKIVGTMPQLIVEGEDDSGDGRIIPTTSADQYAATLAKWFGFSASEINTLFPNLKNFSTSDLGLLL
jgi:uncharacterized protein (DUF1501 family)